MIITYARCLFETLEGIVKDIGVTLNDVVGVERFQDDLAELLQYPESVRGLFSVSSSSIRMIFFSIV